MSKKAVVLISGGLDSTTCIAIAKDAGFEIAALTINYGQRHKFELDAAKQVVNHYQINNHSTIDIDLSQFGGSALTRMILKYQKVEMRKICQVYQLLTYPQEILFFYHWL